MASTLVHIGWPKTGTTWLQEKLFIQECGYAQPLAREDIIRELVLPDQLGFDAEGLRRRWEERLQRTPAGLVPVVSHERLCGVLQNRLESVVLGERLVASLAEPRVFIVVREQRSAMLASWQQYVRDGGSPAAGPAVRSLSDYYGDEASRGSVLPPPGGLHYFEYHRLVEWYVDRLGPSRVLVLPLELLRRSPHDFLAQVRDFSGASPRQAPDLMASNEAWAPVSYAAKRWLNYVGDRSRFTPSRRSRYQLVMLSAYKFDSLVPARVRRIGVASRRRSVETMAGRHFVASNRRLAELVSWNPEEFGYMT